MEEITSVLTITEDTVESAQETQDSSSVTSVTTLGETAQVSASENQLSSRTTDYDVVRATNALLVGAAAYRDPGFFAGRDGGKIKVSVGNDFYYDGSTLTVAGAISASTIDIGGFDATSFHVDVDGNMWLGAATFASAPFKVSNAGAATMTGATISGSITATTGTIGGWVVTSDAVKDAAGTVGMSSAVTAGDDVRFWAGDSTPGSAEFRVTESGALFASTATVTGALTTGAGSSVNGTYLVASSVLSGSVNLALMSWTITCVFSITDADTVAWGAGTLTAADGTAYSISAGNTGNMAARTFVYLDTAVSSTVLQTTTTAATAVGNGKLMVMTAINGTTEPTYVVFSGASQTNIDGGSVAALSITAAEIAAATITGGKIAASTITATNITAGTITTSEIAANTIVGGNISSLNISTKTLVADTGTVGGWTMGAASLSAGSGSTTVGLDVTVTGGDDVRIYAGSATPSSAPFRVTESGALVATSATITGSVTATSGTIGGFSVGTDYVRDAANSFGLASTVTGSDDVRFWAGDTFANRATAPFRVTEAGAVTATTFTATTPSTTTVVGAMSPAVLFTAGEAITLGQNVSVDSSTGTIFRTRVTALGTQNTATTAVAVNTMAAPSATLGARGVRFLNVSSTVKLALWMETGSSYLAYSRCVIDPSVSTAPTITEDAITSSIASSNGDLDAVVLSDTTVLILYTSTAGTLYARVLSGLDTGVTINTEYSLATTIGTGCAIAYVSATEAIAFYYVSATEVRAMKVTVTGTVVAASTTSTVYSTATDQMINAAYQLGTSSTYIICFSQSTTTFRGIAGTYSAGSMTMGSAVTIESYNALGVSMASSDSTHAIVAYAKSTDAVGSVRCLSVSGTTLTSNAAYSLPSCEGNKNVCVSALGTNTFAVGYQPSATNRNELQLLELTGTTVTIFGSLLTLTNRTNEETCIPVYHSPTRLLAMEFYDSNIAASTIDLTNNHSSWIGIANQSIASAATGYVVTHGTSPVPVTTLATGSLYYTDIDGAFTTLTNGTRVGIAYSTTQLVVRS